MPNSFAYLVFLSWPLVMLVLFRRLPLAQALAVSVVAGYLLLPLRMGWNFPMIPTIDKTFLIGVGAAIMCLFAYQQERLNSAVPVLRVPGAFAGALAGRLPAPPDGATRPGGRWLIYLLLSLLVIGPFITVMTNGEPVRWGPRTLPGIRPYDALSMIGKTTVQVLPFLLAMAFLGTDERHRMLLRVLAVAGALYAVLAAFELRMAPQLNIWIYGFFPHQWLQHVRGGAFRPVVFMQHALWLGIFLAIATLAACVLWRQAIRDRIGTTAWLWVAVWLALVLLLSRTFGATLIVLAIAPVIIWTSLRTQVIVAGVLAGMVLTYPMLRTAGLVPTDRIIALVEMISPERAGSLQTRVTNEDRLLAHAGDKPLAGWGDWGRNRVYRTDNGQDITITDGAWVIIKGVHGWIGYFAQFGLLTLPIVLLALRRREHLSTATVGLMLVSVAGLVDLLPNATLTPVTWLIGGAVAGRYLRSVNPAPDAAPQPAGPGRRFGSPQPLLGQRGVSTTGPGAPALAARPAGAVAMNGTALGRVATQALPPAGARGVAPQGPRHQRRPRG
jgi:hypothetical protein